MLFILILLLGIALGMVTGYAVTVRSAARVYERRVTTLINARRARVIW